MRRIMRARIHATRLLQVRAKVARRRLLLYHCLLSSQVFQVFHHHVERMQVDVPVRAIPRAQAAPDAPILNNHFQ
jgi:hypothetical protein